MYGSASFTACRMHFIASYMHMGKPVLGAAYSYYRMAYYDALTVLSSYIIITAIV